MQNSFKQLIKYGIVGVIGLAIDWLFFFLFRDALGIPYWVSHIMSSALAILNNFLWNSYFTFKPTDKLVKRGISFFGIAAVGLIISSILLPWGVRIINVYLYDFIPTDNQKVIQNISKIAVTVLIAFLQFFANKYLTFRSKSPKS